ncbi:MAG TPA: sulfite exporter TauE/SafE family protein [Burkholderiales bacterium]|nr:sulfite exporter TauE/SafE family protein [Burkholderiales bacterium]
MILLLAAVAIVVGFFIGAVGVGGILLIPPLVWLGGLSIHEAAASALLSFLATGMLGTWLFQRRGSIDWKMAAPICIGAIAFSYLGAMVNSIVEARQLALIIAIIIIFAGAYILLPSRRIGERPRDGRGAAQQALLLSVGAVAGFGAGFSGAGGPLFSVPIMLLLRFVPLATIGASQVLQIVVSISGTIGNLQYGSVNFVVVGWITLFELIGVAIGTRAAHAVSPAVLRRMAASLCIALGLVMLTQSL